MLRDVGVYVRSMYMSGRRVCEINVYVNFLVTHANGCGVYVGSMCECQCYVMSVCM